jgi:hypothetical protein
MKNHINRTIQDTIITALQAYQPLVSDEGRFPDEAEKEYNKNFEAKCNKTGINLLAEPSDADVAEAIDQVEETRRKAQKELDALIETKSRYDHQIEIGDPWNWKWEESWHPLAVERHKQTIKNANLAIAALRQVQTEWIPVSERLPTEELASVLVYTKDGGVSEGQYYPTIKSWKQFRWSVENATVTHWMPLPKPPESEG